MRDYAVALRVDISYIYTGCANRRMVTDHFQRA